mmetsp:Transcript_14069/g.19534  ORF Transcript_14069/g.19534 Transcript_14069/m.19534 type:complete len:108 (+) Transcript_14069:1572-1895(+)
MMLNDDSILIRMRAHPEAQSTLYLHYDKDCNCNRTHFTAEAETSMGFPSKLQTYVAEILDSQPLKIDHMRIRARTLRRCLKDPSCYPQLAQWKSLDWFVSKGITQGI